MGKSAAAEPQQRIELTPKQREVLALIASGRTNAEIAEELGVSLDGAKWHVREILGKLNVASREAAAEWWRKNGRSNPIARLAHAVFAPLAWRWFGAGAAALVLATGTVAFFVALKGGASPADTTAMPGATAARSPTVATATAPAVVSTTPAPAATAPTIINGFQPGGLALIRDGNLWVTAETGTPQRAQGETQVTTGGGLSYPRWSPNGRYLFVSGFGKDWLVSIKGDLTPLDDCRAPIWSPGGDMLACIDPAGDLVILPVEPGLAPLRVLVPAPADGSRTLSLLAWAPDGRSLAYLSSGDRLSPHDIMLVDFASGATRTIGRVQGDVLGPKWVGNYLYYQLNPSLSASILADGAEGYAMDMRSGEVTDLGWRLAYPDAIAPRPKNDQVAIIAGAGRQAWTGKSLKVAAIPGTPEPWPALPAGGVPASPAWSADGDRIAYVSAPDSGPLLSGGDAAKALLQQRRIYIQDADGAQPPKLLVDQPGYRDEHPQFDSTGSILFARIGPDGTPALWLWDAQENGLLRHMTGPIDWPYPGGPLGDYGHIAWEAVYDWYPGHHYQRGGL